MPPKPFEEKNEHKSAVEQSKRDSKKVTNQRLKLIKEYADYECFIENHPTAALFGCTGVDLNKGEGDEANFLPHGGINKAFLVKRQYIRFFKAVKDEARYQDYRYIYCIPNSAGKIREIDPIDGLEDNISAAKHSGSMSLYTYYKAGKFSPERRLLLMGPSLQAYVNSAFENKEEQKSYRIKYFSIADAPPVGYQLSLKDRNDPQERMMFNRSMTQFLPDISVDDYTIRTVMRLYCNPRDFILQEFIGEEKNSDIRNLIASCKADGFSVDKHSAFSLLLYVIKSLKGKEKAFLAAQGRLQELTEALTQATHQADTPSGIQAGHADARSILQLTQQRNEANKTFKELEKPFEKGAKLIRLLFPSLSKDILYIHLSCYLPENLSDQQLAAEILDVLKQTLAAQRNEKRLSANATKAVLSRHRGADFFRQLTTIIGKIDASAFTFKEKFNTPFGEPVRCWQWLHGEGTPQKPYNWRVQMGAVSKLLFANFNPRSRTLTTLSLKIGQQDKASVNRCYQAKKEVLIENKLESVEYFQKGFNSGKSRPIKPARVTCEDDYYVLAWLTGEYVHLTPEYCLHLLIQTMMDQCGAQALQQADNMLDVLDRLPIEKLITFMTHLSNKLAAENAQREGRTYQPSQAADNDIVLMDPIGCDEIKGSATDFAPMSPLHNFSTHT
jgi:hypothetical protein